jgi:hypothetical protein
MFGTGSTPLLPKNWKLAVTLPRRLGHTEGAGMSDGKQSKFRVCCDLAASLEGFSAVIWSFRWRRSAHDP